MNNKMPYFLVTIDSNYCDYLRKFDLKVSYNMNQKSIRPFVGVLFEVNDVKYFAPLSSPKAKHLKMHNNIDFIKIDDGKLGAINLNNMIPVSLLNYSIIDISKICFTKQEMAYQQLLSDQLRWLNRYCKDLRSVAFKLYNLKCKNKLPLLISDRCCDYQLLEIKCIEFFRVNKIFPSLKHIKDINNLYYIYDILKNKEDFEKIILIIEREKLDISNMNNEEINSLISRYGQA